MPKEVLAFSDRSEYDAFSKEVEYLCDQGKLEQVDLPELKESTAGERMPSVQFYKETKTGVLWLLKLPSGDFNGSFTILPKVVKRNPLPKFEPMYNELMSIWKKVMIACVAIIVIALLIYKFMYT